jgi:hypothetical protein
VSSGPPADDATTKLVVSDLHLGDGDSILETWRAPQQEAWERLLRDAMPGGPYSAGPMELIVNGDCFDFLATAHAPTEGGAIAASGGLARIAYIIAAHGAWFAALRAWLHASGGSITFLIGNHDAELAFGAVRARIRAALAAPPGAVRFCLARIYRPLPDVVIEHGCQFDPWNAIPGLWDDAAHAVPAGPAALETFDARGTEGPPTVALPWGSRYYYRVMLPIARHFPYLAALHPPISQMAGLALLCLYAPDLVLAGAHHTRALREDGGAADAPLADHALDAERDPATLFRAVLPEVAALRGQVWRRAGAASGAAAPGTDRAGAETLARALAAGELPALRTIFAGPAGTEHTMPEEDAIAAAALFGADPAARVALCGHTHVEGSYPLIDPDGRARRFLNTGTWHPRLAWPEPDTLDVATAFWLRDPLTAPSPLASATAFTYALLRASPGQPTSVELREV